MKVGHVGRAGRSWIQGGSPDVRVALAGALLLLGLTVFRSDLAFLFAPDPQLSFVLVEDLYHGVVSQGLVTLEGAIPGPSGFYIPPGGRGRVWYRASWREPVTPWARLELSALLGQRAPRGRVSLSVDGGRHFQMLAENRPLMVEQFQIGSLLRGQRQLTLLFEGSNLSAEPLLLTAQINLMVYAENPLPAPPLGRVMPAFLLFGLGSCLFLRRWPRLLPLLGILTVGFLGRYLNFLRLLYGRPDPDAAFYRIFADKLVPFTATGFYSGSFDTREPFFPLIAKAVFAVFGSSDTHLRLVSLGASLLVIALTWRLGRRLLGEAWAWLPAAAVAFSVPLVVESGRGLRLEVEMVLLLLFADVAFANSRLQPFPRFVIAGSLAGLLLLTRSSYLPGLTVLLILAAWRSDAALRSRALLGGLGISIMVALYAPHVAALYRVHGDPFYDQAKLTRWLANVEFAGQPGFPTKEDVARNAFVGPRISFWEYIFKLHTPGEIATGFIRGFGKILFHMDMIGYPVAVERLVGIRLGWMDWLVRLLGWAAILLILRRQEVWLPIAVIVLTLPVAFPYDRGVIEKYRLTLMVFPFFVCGIGLLGRQVAEAFRAPASIAHGSPAIPQGTRPLQKLSILIPVFNEVHTIREILQEVDTADAAGLEKELVIVDDGSTDGTREILRTLDSLKTPFQVLFHAHNTGKGAAIRTALAEATGDVVLIQDADREYDSQDYPKLLEPILKGRADVVFGNRFHGGPHRVFYFWHAVGNWILTTLSNILTNLNLNDMEVGYKAFRRDLLKQIRIRSNRFGFEPEITVKVARAGARIYEVPISYHGRTYQEGKKITWKDGLVAIYHLTRFRFFD